MAFDVKGGVAVVTGAASGMGAELALQLAGKGCALALADRNADQLKAVADRCRAKQVKVTEHVLDVTDTVALEALPGEVLAQHGRANLLVNNAGVALMGRFDQVSMDDFQWVMDINFWAPVRLTKAFLPILEREKAAHIVNLSSVFGLFGPPAQAPYVASKFAIRGFSESLRHELEGTGITLTVVHPGGVRTAIADSARVSSGINEAEAKEAKGAFNTFLKTPADVAAARILRGIERRQPRVLIGRDAVGGDIVQRLMPGAYWKLMKTQMGKMERFVRR